MKVYFSLLLVIPFGSCSLYERHNPSKKEKEDVFKTVVYDKKTIDDFPKYNLLAELLLNNLDYIIRDMNSKNYITVINADGKESKQLQRQNCYMFLSGNDSYDIKKIPASLSLIADSLWKVIGNPQMELCNETGPSSFVIKKNFIKRVNRILECHFIYWNLNNPENKNSFDFVKDTALSKNCTYRIGVTTDNSGW